MARTRDFAETRVTQRPRISLVIPAHNEARYIGGTLASVARARNAFHNPSLIEVIVVDNFSTDGTGTVARGQGARVVLEEERRIASVRNEGAKAARGELLGFLDADSWVTPNIFRAIDGVMSSGKYIGGGTDLRLERRSPGILLTYCITTLPAKWVLGVGAGLIFTDRGTFQELGGFDESLYCAEDSEFVLRLKKHGKRRGKRFKVITRARVTTSARSFDRFGDWYYFRNLPRILLRRGEAFRDWEFAKRFWYEIER